MKNYRLKPPQIIISAFLILLIGLSYILHMDLVVLLNESMVKLVMNGVLVLSLIPMLNVGAGMNFGLPVGIIGGLIGMCLAVNYRMTGFYGFFMAILFTLMICTLLGWIYGLILNRVKGREEIAGIFIGFTSKDRKNLYFNWLELRTHFDNSHGALCMYYNPCFSRNKIHVRISGSFCQYRRK